MITYIGSVLGSFAQELSASLLTTLECIFELWGTVPSTGAIFFLSSGLAKVEKAARGDARERALSGEYFSVACASSLARFYTLNRSGHGRVLRQLSQECEISHVRFLRNSRL